jgi:hypothetical protein
MFAAFAEARQALQGVLEMLAGRTDFHARFDVSPAGVRRSFAAAFLAIPFWAFTVLVQYAVARQSADDLGPLVEPYTLAYAVIRWAAIWAHFPLLAALVTVILGRRNGFAPWVVVHNWTHLFIVMVQLPPLALIALGAVDLGAVLLRVSILVMVYGYVAAAKAGLDVGWRLAIPAGCVALIAQTLVEAGLIRVL